MGGVDMSDQMLEPYNDARKPMAWYKKLATCMVQISLCNAYIVYKYSTRASDHISRISDLCDLQPCV